MVYTLKVVWIQSSAVKIKLGTKCVEVSSLRFGLSTDLKA